MEHLLQMTCTVTKKVEKDPPEFNSYGHPILTDDDTEGVKCLYLTVRDKYVQDEHGRDILLEGELYVMPDVDISEGYLVTDIEAMTGTVESGPLEVVGMRVGNRPSGVQHRTALLCKARVND